MSEPFTCCAVGTESLLRESLTLDDIGDAGTVSGMTCIRVLLFHVLQMRRASVRGGARTPMTEPSIWQRSCHLSFESIAFQGVDTLVVSNTDTLS